MTLGQRLDYLLERLQKEASAQNRNLGDEGRPDIYLKPYQEITQVVEALLEKHEF